MQIIWDTSILLLHIAALGFTVNWEISPVPTQPAQFIVVKVDFSSPRHVDIITTTTVHLRFHLMLGRCTAVIMKRELFVLKSLGSALSLYLNPKSYPYRNLAYPYHKLRLAGDARLYVL